MWPFSIVRKRREARERRILDALRERRELSGYELSQKTDMSSASLYPALIRLERAGVLTSRWGVATVASGGNRPRLYSLTRL